MDSRLEEFEKKLYKRGGEEEKKLGSYEVYKEEMVGKKWGGWQGDGHPFGRARGGRGLSLVLAFFFGALVIVGGYYWYTRQTPFDPKSVQGEISGPAHISSGDEVAFTVTYRNNAGVALRDATILFTWPEGTVSADAGTTIKEMKADIGMIVPRQEKSVTFKGRMYGAKDQEKDIAVSFQYTPETVASPFEDKKTIPVTIVATPLALTITAPAQVVADKEAQITVEYQNQSDARFENMELHATYPAGFTATAVDPAPSGDNATVWKLGTIEGRAGGKITIKGTFSGAQGESKSLYFELGAPGSDNAFLQYATADSAATISSSALFVFQTVNDSRDYAANPGATLRYRIRYKNTTNIQIPNAVILAKIDDSFVDVKSLSVQWGSFDGRTNSIIWNAVGVPQLAVLDPKEEGEVSFSVNLKSSFLPKKFSDKNFIVASTVRITAAATPDSLDGLPLESEDTLNVKVHTQFAFNETAYYDNGLIQNSGSLPPRVGQRTTFAVSWQLSNTINDVDNVEVTAVVPPNVEWTGVVYPQDAAITYDQNSGVITWKPGKVFAGTGFLTPPKRVDFQVAFVPALVHVGEAIPLVSGATLKASDTFTGLAMTRQVAAVDTDLLNSIKSELGKVMQ